MTLTNKSLCFFQQFNDFPYTIICILSLGMSDEPQYTTLHKIIFINVTNLLFYNSINNDINLIHNILIEYYEVIT